MPPSPLNFESGYPRGPTHILMTGVRVIFWGLTFWPKVIFLGLRKDAEIFLGCEKKTEGFFWVAKKGLRDFFGYAKKSDFFG